jgi:acyl-coenzyme A synthetase/AMP-(fatty) acid ligase
MRYASAHEESVRSPQGFWSRQAERIAWYTPPSRVHFKDAHGLDRWYEGGTLNTSYLALDFHVENGRGEQTALIYDSPVTKQIRAFTYRELRDDVARFAGVLRNRGVGKGDRVVLYMPMVPEAVIAMLACARLGAVHSVVFGGFAPHELAMRIDDARPAVLVSASCGIEVDKVIAYKPLLDRALKEAAHRPAACIILQRPECRADMNAAHDFDWHAELATAVPVHPVPVAATDPLYILYTSGTTGKPKGVVRDNGGHAVALRYSMETVYDAKPGDVFWAASDVGWVVGHSYIVYGPLLHGCTTVLYEGKPVKTPDAGAFWRVISRHHVNIFFTAPTAFRAVKKEDPAGILRTNYDLSSLRHLFLAGERLDPPTYHWAKDLLGVPVTDHWWQTESGWPMVANMRGLEPFEPRDGSAGKPVCGFDVQILDEAGTPVARGETGAVVVKLPLPPGCLPTLWQDEERYRDSYLSRFPGYYLTGDGGFIDKDGYVFIMGRVDDVINVAGHRLSTGEMEEILAGHPAVAECAVIGVNDELRGQVPAGFVVLKDGLAGMEPHRVADELVARIRDQVGAVACFRQVAVVQRLPKTRSGKILRATMRKLAGGETVAVPSTIDDPKVLDEIRAAMLAEKIGRPAPPPAPA